MTRPSVKDRTKFLYIAKGSCAELRTLNSSNKRSTCGVQGS
ncbi:hypothetical protein OCT48_10420 [Halomonas sp. M4R1S46]|nr:hypothetical protein [Halomonas sp. M4R1S46]UYG06064.1 hypothetical protein OCT48_10420 [Halomonas sp. M4R1S46]